MWIQTQNKQRIINSDHIIDIYINKTGTSIYANTIDPEEFKLLGEYQDRDTCMKILEALSLIGTNIPTINMPLGSEVETWLKDIVADLGTYYIAKEFK